MKHAAYQERRAQIRARREEIYRKESKELSAKEMALSDEVRREYALGLSNETPYFGQRPIEVIIGDDGVHLWFADRHDDVYRADWMSAALWGRFAEIMNTYERWVLGHIDEMPPSGPWPPPSWGT